MVVSDNNKGIRHLPNNEQGIGKKVENCRNMNYIDFY